MGCVMSNSPVLELQALAGDPSSDIVAVLLKAKMIAVKLNLNDLSEWLEYEIDGYPSCLARVTSPLKFVGFSVLIN